MAIRMGYWDCSGCGKKRIQGPERSCSDCGRPRDQDVKFYTDDSAPAVDDAGELAKARAGADWHCPYCGADNPKGSTSCVGCGATGEGASSRQERIIPDGAAPRAAATARTTAPATPKPAPPPTVSMRPIPKSRAKSVGVAVGAVLALLLAFYFLFVRTSPLLVTVSGTKWVKALEVERLETQRDEAWAGEVPAGGREIRRYTSSKQKRVQVGTKRVKVGTKDLGNGYFEDAFEDRPEYEDRMVDATKVVYEIDRWVKDKTLKNESTDGTEPEFPVFNETSRERIADRKNELILSLESGEKEKYTYTLNLENGGALRAKLPEYSVGSRHTAMVNAIGTVLELRGP
jgi:hypothetical protein